MSFSNPFLYATQLSSAHRYTSAAALCHFDIFHRLLSAARLTRLAPDVDGIGVQSVTISVQNSPSASESNAGRVAVGVVSSTGRVGGRRVRELVEGGGLGTG